MGMIVMDLLELLLVIEVEVEVVVGVEVVTEKMEGVVEVEVIVG